MISDLSDCESSSSCDSRCVTSDRIPLLVANRLATRIDGEIPEATLPRGDHAVREGHHRFRPDAHPIKHSCSHRPGNLTRPLVENSPKSGGFTRANRHHSYAGTLNRPLSTLHDGADVQPRHCPRPLRPPELVPKRPHDVAARYLSEQSTLPVEHR